MWHMTSDTWWEVNILSEFQLPSFYGLGKTVFEDLEEKDEWLNDLMTKVFLEQSWIQRGC